MYFKFTKKPLYLKTSSSSLFIFLHHHHKICILSTTSSSSTPTPPEALTPPTLMAERRWLYDGFESNLSRSRDQQKCEAHRKNDMRFLRNTACTETQLWVGQVNGVRFWCYIGGQLQRGDEDTTPFHESITIFLTMYLGVGQSNNVFWSDYKDGKTPINNLALWIYW
ncbi:hypothetical protein Bca4012_031715 [Brassica carinata]|uniref:IP5PC-F beta-propeller domain-containing protein n=1 Tax=Brassica carinata TaxID=52824 RepID=A0A8X7UP55_BRACI|nr:hypothetical protein Bca52824_046554 [Brassica carinata]